MNRLSTPVQLATLTLLALAGTAAAQNTERVSMSSTSTAGNNTAAAVHITPGGRFAVFASSATNLVANDTNGRFDIFVRDRLLNTTVRVNVPDPSQPGTEANDFSSITSIGRVVSDNGRFVIFTSDATNLVANDVNGVSDVFVRDRDLDGNGTFDEPGVGKTKTTRVSVSSNESQSSGSCPNQICDHFAAQGVISANGRYVAWESSFDFTNDPTAFSNVYWRDRDADNDGIFDEVGGAPDAAVTRLVSRRINGSQFVGQTGDGFSRGAAISADGRWVAFESLSRFMVFSDTVQNNEIFARDMFTDSQNIRLSEPVAGGQPDGSASGPQLSSNGRYVAFVSSANNLALDVNPNFQNVLLKDRDTDNDGVLDEPGTVSFTNCSIGRNPLVIPNGIVNLSGDSFRPTISSDGRYVAFDTAAGNYACGFGGCADGNNLPDVLVFDRVQVRTVRASVSLFDDEVTGTSDTANISGDGRFVGFGSNANGIDGNVSTGFDNAYVHALLGAANDDCTLATPVTAVMVLFGDTYGAAAGGDVSCGLDADTTSALWYSYTATCTGQMTVSTAGSSYDTVLAAFNGPCPATAAKQIACNDDFGGQLTSQITFPIVSGQTTFIRLGGYFGQTGFFQLSLNAPACAPTCAVDFNDDGILSPDDLDEFITTYFTLPPDNNPADFNNDGIVSPDDLDEFITAYFEGC